MVGLGKKSERAFTPWYGAGVQAVILNDISKDYYQKR